MVDYRKPEISRLIDNKDTNRSWIDILQRLQTKQQQLWAEHERDPTEAKGNQIIGFCKAIDIVREYVLTTN